MSEATKVVELIKQYEFSVDIRGTIIELKRSFKERSNHTYIELEAAADRILSLIKQTTAGSTWGSTSDSVGGALALQNGVFRMCKSGCSKRLLAQIQKLMPVAIKYVNLTPHAIHLNDGRVFPPSGTVARVSSTFSQFDGDVCQQYLSDLTGLPSKAKGVKYIVSAMVLAALKGQRKDVVAPATGHQDCMRNEAGHILSVPGFTIS